MTHLTKTLVHRFITKALCRNLLRSTSDMPSTADFMSLHFHKLHRFWFCLKHASNRPAFQDFHKTNPIEARPREHKSSQVEKLGSLRELSLFICLRTAKLSCSPWLPSSAFFGCVPLFSYRESKGHHRRPSRPLGVSGSFTKPSFETNRHAPSQTRSPKQIALPLHRLDHPNEPMHSSVVV
jgi:hypothetical protein